MAGLSSKSENNPRSVVTVSIVSHGDSKEVTKLLESIQSFESADSIQVIITDNLGHEVPEMDGSLWGLINILRNKQTQGFAHNHNQAFQIAKGKFFCVLNPDVTFIQPIFAQLLQRIESQQADIVAPLVIDAQGAIQDSFRQLPTPFEIIRRRFPGYKFDYTIAKSQEMIRPDWMPGFFLFMESSTYRKLGGMNEKYRLYFEDVDFCTRARLAGLKLLVDTIIRVQHDAHRASRKNLIYLLWHVQSAFRFFSSPVYRKANRALKSA